MLINFKLTAIAHQNLNNLQHFCQKKFPFETPCMRHSTDMHAMRIKTTFNHIVEVLEQNKHYKKIVFPHQYIDLFVVLLVLRRMVFFFFPKWRRKFQVHYVCHWCVYVCSWMCGYGVRVERTCRVTLRHASTLHLKIQLSRIFFTIRSLPPMTKIFIL